MDRPCILHGCRFGSARAPGRSPVRTETGILQFSSKQVVEGNRGEVVLEAQCLENPGVNTQRDRRVTLFNAVQCLARDPRSLGDRLGGESPTEPRLPEILSKACEQSRDPGKHWRYLSGHTESYLTPKFKYQDEI